MKSILILALGTLALVEAGIVSPLFYPNLATNYIYPYELRKVVSYGAKPVFTGYATQFVKPDVYGELQFYTFPIVHSQVPSSKLFLIPTVRTLPSTLMANAKAASGAGVAGSSVVAQSDEAVPFSLVANAGPGAAYSSAIVHPSKSGAPVTAGAHASVTGH